MQWCKSCHCLKLCPEHHCCQLLHFLTMSCPCIHGKRCKFCLEIVPVRYRMGCTSYKILVFQLLRICIEAIQVFAAIKDPKITKKIDYCPYDSAKLFKGSQKWLLEVQSVNFGYDTSKLVPQYRAWYLCCKCPVHKPAAPWRRWDTLLSMMSTRKGPIDYGCIDPLWLSPQQLLYGWTNQTGWSTRVLTFLHHCCLDGTNKFQ